MLTHDSNSSDAYVHPQFSLANKVRRVCWMLTWLLLCRWTPAPLHFWRVFVVRMFGGQIGKSNFIYPSCKIWAPWLLTTGDVVTIGPGVEIYNPGGVYLAHHVILSQDSYLCGATHDYNSINFTYVKRKIVIEPYSWICAKAVVLPGVTCKTGSILGASSVTSKDLDEWSVNAGNPAVKVKNRERFFNS